jgi:hypothetical protein
VKALSGATVGGAALEVGRLGVQQLTRELVPPEAGEPELLEHARE